jgi:energy-converting hydrogenase Eha subunit F
MKEKKHHPAVVVVSPARDPAAAGHRTGVLLQTTRHVITILPQYRCLLQCCTAAYSQISLLLT